MSAATASAGGVWSFISKHLLVGLIRASGHSIKLPKAEARNTQCVKLGKVHKNVVQMVSFWCSLRINKLQQMGALKETIDAIILQDARFLTALSHAIDVQKDPEPPYDAWLFFNEDAQSTDFFELQQCARGSKVTKVSYVIHSEC